jgi:regulatory protein
MHVSALRPDPRSPSCLIVEIDGGRVASLPIDIVKELGLVPGEELAPSRYEELMVTARAESARRVGLRLLAARPQAAMEIRRKLRDRGHDAEAIRSALGQLEAAGLVNDAEYARHFARVRAPKGHGPSRLVHDLMGRGVDRSVAERAVAEVAELEGGDPLEQARSLAERRAASLRGLKPQTARHRLMAFLARRGFRGRDVGAVVRQVLDGGHAGSRKREA